MPISLKIFIILSHHDVETDKSVWFDSILLLTELTFAFVTAIHCHRSCSSGKLEFYPYSTISGPRKIPLVHFSRVALVYHFFCSVILPWMFEYLRVRIRMDTLNHPPFVEASLTIAVLLVGSNNCNLHQTMVVLLELDSGTFHRLRWSFKRYIRQL